MRHFNLPPFAHATRLCWWLAIGLWLLTSTAKADWPHLRGPSYDGVSAEVDLADAWPSDGPPRLWSRELGQGYSGFVAGAGKLYTQYQSLGGQFLLCLDPDNGATIWEHRCDWAWQPKGAYPGPYSSPTWYQGKLFYASTNGIVGCVDANSGAPLWSLNVMKQFHGKGTGFGYAATPLVENDLVIVPVGGDNASLVALHVSDGRTVWATGSDPSSYCPAYPITYQGRRCVVGYLQNAFVLVELATGKLLHRQALSAGYDEHSAWPIYREPHLLFASPFRVAAVRYQLSPVAKETLSLKPTWLSKEMCNDVVSSVLYGNHLYGFDLKQLQASAHRTSRGAFKCLNWETGKVRWATEEVGHASVLAADGKLLLFNDTGSLILARADPAAYEELARTRVFDDEEICWTPPTLWQGRLFVRSPSRAVCVWVGRAELAPKSSSPMPTPVVRSWRFDSSWLLSREREFPNDAPTLDEMTLWFAVSLLAFGTAAVLAGLATLLTSRLFARRGFGTLLFFLLVMLLGFLGPNYLSSQFDQCLFTWPASLYAAFHAVVWVCGWAEQQPPPSRARWLARLAIVVFVLIGYLYFEMCKSVGMFIGWSFLVGFPFAFPFTYLAVHVSLKKQRLWLVAFLTVLAFAAYFWSAQGLFLWQSASSETGAVEP